MVGSGRIASECSPGERFSLCRRWGDPADDFADVVVRGRRGPRVSVEMLSGPETGATANVFASSLWAPDQLAYARERRERDLRIAELDREQPVDDVSELAMQILCLIATGDIVIEDEATLGVLLSQLGRPIRLDELHELAYVDGGEVSAPAEAWRGLFEEFARSMPSLIEERVSEIASGWSTISDAERGLAVARIRQWAGLPPIATPLEDCPSAAREGCGEADHAGYCESGISLARVSGGEWRVSCGGTSCLPRRPQGPGRHNVVGVQGDRCQAADRGVRRGAARFLWKGGGVAHGLAPGSGWRPWSPV